MPEVSSRYAEEDHESFRITSTQPEIRTPVPSEFKSGLLSVHCLAQKYGMKGEQCVRGAYL
jgi:hypothetical protein